MLLLHGPVGSSKSTIARLLKKGLERYSKTDEGALFTYGWREEGLDGTDTFADCPMHEEPLHLIPAEHRAGVLDVAQRRGRDADDFQVTIEGDLCPFCRQMFNERLEQYDGDWSRVLERRPRPPPDPLRAGPHRHRHLPAQGREEPGRDRADRRHQLSQDRRVRHRQRPPRLQLRRRVQHRQPRPRRVHRGPEARRRLPLRPARRQPGAQDQAEEVRPDRHRRGDPRPHQRAGIQEAPEQRVHGGAARPDGQDRRALRHPAHGRDPDLREGLQQPEGPGQADRPAHDRGRRDVGGADPARGAQERQPDPAAEAEALQRQDAARLHRGQHHGADARRPSDEGMHGISPRYVQDKISNALVAHPDERLASTRSWSSRAGGRPASTTR